MGMIRIIIVGGGFTGVEVAGEINDLIKAGMRFYSNITAGEVTVTLVHIRDQILPEVSPTLREFARTKMEQAGIHMILNARAVSATAEGVELQAGRILRGATVVCTIGTTIRKAGSHQEFRTVDFDYPLAIARIALAQGARHFLLVSALGANAGSRWFYNRVKGELGSSDPGSPIQKPYHCSALAASREARGVPAWREDRGMARVPNQIGSS